MSDPIIFDPAVYVADLRAAGFTVHYHPPVRDGEPCFSILSQDGFSDDLLDVERKHRAARRADPEAKRKVMELLAREAANG